MRRLPAILLVLFLGATTQPADDPAVHIRRMIEAGTPELAETQARELIASGHHDPLAIGVVASVYAGRGEMGAAIQQLKMALMQAPDDPFLLRLAGQLVAWHDSQVDRTRLTVTDVQMLEWVRKTVAGKPAFAEVYRALVTLPPTPPVVIHPPVVVQQPPVIVHVESPRERYIYPIFPLPIERVPPAAPAPKSAPPAPPAPQAPFHPQDDRGSGGGAGFAPSR